MKRRKKESGVAAVLLGLVAVIFVAGAIYVIISVFDKITSDYKQLETETATEALSIESETEKKESLGWNETDNGWKYKTDEKNYAVAQCLEIEGFLYYFDENGFMVTGQWKKDGQIYTCHDTKGYLKNIETDLDYVPESTGENLDSLARTNAFWCYLDSQDTGLFKTILFRKTVDNKVKPLGDENAPEKTTRYSLRADGDYVYYLPKVKESRRLQLTESEKSLCDTLMRMIPGQDKKEVIAQQVGGYLILDGTIYYSQGGKIYSAKEGTETALGDSQYSVVVKDDNCYLVDAMGNTVSGGDMDTITVGDRLYRVEEDGKIKYVKHAEVTVEDTTYSLSGNVVYGAASGGNKTVIKSEYGVQSFCIVDKSILYSAYVDKGVNGEWYTQIFKCNLDGSEKTAVSHKIEGTVSNMYYFEKEGQIYGEYHPAIWQKAYGTVIQIGRDGSINQISDSAARTGNHVAGNDMLELIAVQDGEIICLWHDCQWNKNSGITGVLWSKAITLSAAKKTPVEEAAIQSEAETIAVPIKPSTETPAISVPNTPQSGLVHPAESSGGAGKPEVVIGTDGPGKATAAPTVPPATKPAGDVKIVPLG